MRQDAHAAQILEGDIRPAGQWVRIWDGDIQLLMQERLGEEISGISSQLGTSPISSVPYVISLISPLSVGTATILMHCVFILIQIFILRRRYELIQLMQLPVALIFRLYV